MKTYGVRLRPDEDLKKRIVEICIAENIQSACVLSAVGSLKQLNIRLASSKNNLQKSENFEILSLNGTVSVDGIHLHLAVADQHGQVLGGHLLDGNLIFTTCELVLLDLAQTPFTRRLDKATGFREIEFT